MLSEAKRWARLQMAAYSKCETPYPTYLDTPLTEEEQKVYDHAHAWFLQECEKVERGEIPPFDVIIYDDSE